MTAKKPTDVQQLRDDMNAELVTLRESIAVNTKITQATKADVAALRVQAQPVLDAMETMEAGIRTIGRIGDAGLTVGKGLLVVAAVWGCVKLFFGGASWAEITQTFYRSIGK